MKITVKEFIELMRAEKILWQISDERMLNGDIEFQGTDEGTVKRYQEFLDATPKLKAALILSVVVHDPERLEALEMSAARRWCDGYSDSLLSVILANLGVCNDSRLEGELRPITDQEAEKTKYEGLLTIRTPE